MGRPRKIKEKAQCPIRLDKDKYDRIKAKVIDDGISFQKLCEIFFNAYLRGNKEFVRLVKKYASDRDVRRRRYDLNDVERDEILSRIERDYSPLRELEEAIEELQEDEQEQSNIYF